MRCSVSLTLVRMLLVAIAMVGSDAKRETVGFLGWFGPRGLASIVFAVIAVEEAHLTGADTILLAAYLTIGLSVVAHGITAAPLARRYGRWYEAHRQRPPTMESDPAPRHRARQTNAKLVRARSCYRRSGSRPRDEHPRFNDS